VTLFFGEREKQPQSSETLGIQRRERKKEISALKRELSTCYVQVELSYILKTI